MKRILTLCLGLSFFGMAGLPAQAHDQQLVNLVLEKKVMGTLVKGNRPMIDPQHYQTNGFEMPSMASAPVQIIGQPVAPGEAKLLKEYRVVDSPDQFQSLIQIQDLTHQKTRGYLNVARRIRRLVAAPHRHRLYALCGGYFGSVWEIDTQRDVVIRKLPAFTPRQANFPLWNPQDMVLMPDGTLALGSGKLQLIDSRSGELTGEIALPDNAVEIEVMQVLSAKTLGLRVRMDNGKRQYFQYHLGERGLQPGGKATQVYAPLKVRIQTPYGLPPAVSRVFFVAGRNTDYIRMVDRDSLHTMGILPVDFNVDDLVVSPDRKRLFVYHRRFGQVSVIELNPRSPEQYSVIRRFRDQRFHSDSPMHLVATDHRVFLWDGEGQVVASFEQDSLYPRIGLPVETSMNTDRVWVSKPAYQRYYLRDGMLYAEYLGGGPSSLPQRLELGASVTDFVLSPDRKHLYALTSDTRLQELDPRTHERVQQITLGMQPRYLSISNDGQRLSIVDADQGSMREVRAADLQVTREVVMDMGEKQPYQITLFDPHMTQIVEVELPRYLNDVVRVAR